MAEALPIFPIIRFFSMNRNRVVRLLIGGQCVGCKSVHVRNICIFQFVLNIAHPFLTDTFHYVPRVKSVPVHDDDFKGIVEGMGGWVSEIIDLTERKTFVVIQKFMLNIHQDINDYVGVVHQIDENDE